ncbi:MAG TPA: hypothetical protein VIR56_16535 [Solimonas sp.]
MSMKLLSYGLLVLSLFAVGLGFGTWQQHANAASMPDIAAIMAPACLTHAAHAEAEAPSSPGQDQQTTDTSPG